jgi:hypothetical protein
MASISAPERRRRLGMDCGFGLHRDEQGRIGAQPEIGRVFSFQVQ